MLPSAGMVSTVAGQASRAGGAGHALLFSDHAPVIRNFKVSEAHCHHCCYLSSHLKLLLVLGVFDMQIA